MNLLQHDGSEGIRDPDARPHDFGGHTNLPSTGYDTPYD
ncbi:hypothetical protein ACVW0J_007593 [Bradyrhizobium sp. i1.7.7]